MKLLKILLFFSIFPVILNLPIVNAVPNPAAVYCKNLGYEYKIVKTPQGEYGVCVFPDKECEEWEFFKGICGKEYSYCAKQGYDSIIKIDGKNPFSRHYAVCVRKKREIGSVTDLMNLREILKTSIETTEEEVVTESEFITTATIPSDFDWRNKDGQNWMTPVKNQGACGSCWIFGPIGATEAKTNIVRNNPNFNVDLSEQDILSCCEWYGTCSIGYSWSTVNCTGETGVVDEDCFPYSATEEPCSNKYSDWNDRLWTISGWGYVPSGPPGHPAYNRDEIKNYLIDKGPLIAGVYMGGYWDGDIYRCTGDVVSDHSLVLVGYNDAGGYWIAKNSWGDTWNGDGYFKVGYEECDFWPDKYLEKAGKCLEGGTGIDGLCYKACGASPECHEKTPGSTWCDGSFIAKGCYHNCEHYSIDCRFWDYDHDGGVAYFTKGECDDGLNCIAEHGIGTCGGQRYTDYCLDSYTLREYYVYDSGVDSVCTYVDKSCKCSDGRCCKPERTSCTSSNECCSNFCDYGRCRSGGGGGGWWPPPRMLGLTEGDIMIIIVTVVSIVIIVGVFKFFAKTK